MDSEVGGQIQGISIESFLQMAQMEKMTCTLTVNHAKETGHLYILNGELISAEAGTLQGPQAAYEIISWEKSVISVDNSCSKKKDKIDQSLMDVLKEGLKLRDKKKLAAIKQKKPEQEKAKPAPLKKPPAQTASTAESEKEKAVQPKQKKERPKKKAEKISLPKKSKRPTVVIAVGVAFVIAVAAVAGFVVLKKRTARKDYEALLSRVEKQPDLKKKKEILKSYLSAHNGDPYTDDAQKQMKNIDLIAEDRAFHQAQSKVEALPKDGGYEKAAKEIYNDFLTSFPNGMHRDEVKKKITGLPTAIENDDFTRLQSIIEKDLDQGIEAVRHYLVKHPEGKHRDKVVEWAAMMENKKYLQLKDEISRCRQLKQWDGCIGLCDRFITDFQNSRHIEEIRNIKNDLAGEKDLNDLKDKIKQANHDPEKARAIYRTYLDNHPETTLKKVIEDRLSQLDEQIGTKDRWFRVRDDAENAGKDIFSRVKLVENYIRKNPSSPYIKEAKKILTVLHREKQNQIVQQRAAAEKKRAVEKIARKKALRQKEARRIKQATEMITKELKQRKGRFIVHHNGTVSDKKTGLMWCILDSQIALQKCVNHKNARLYVEGLTVGGYKDWRLPTSGELAGIYKSEPAFPVTEATWYWASKVISEGYHRKAEIVTTKKTRVFKREYANIKKCGAVRAVRP